MQWKAKRFKSDDEKYPTVKPWHWWFAWYSVETSGRKYWLCWIPRRYVRRRFFFSYSYVPEYSYPEHSIAGNILGETKGRRHGPNKNGKPGDRIYGSAKGK